MSATQPKAPMPGRGLTEVLLENKLSPPPVTANLVSRRSVVDRARSSACRAVGITAPAGYGKTTLLTEWANLEDRPLAWVSLDRFDDDPTSLLVALASAYAALDPRWSELAAEMSGPGISTLGRATPRLAGAFAAARQPFVLMLDDLHEVQSPDCLDVLQVLMARFPSKSQLVSSSRSEQMHLARMRAMDDAFEIGIAELALDDKGAQQIFMGSDVQLTRDQANAVTTRTEGWAVGLQLAALIAKGATGEVPEVTGDDRYVGDYLYQEILVRQPEDLQRFLRRTSVLEQLSGPLCDAVLESKDATQRLRALEGSGLFLIGLDRRRRWYRYHSLFREFLLSELYRCDAAEVDALHVKASDWYEEQGFAEMALEHLLQTSEGHRAALLLTEMAQPTYQSGRLATTLRWLAMIGDSSIRDYPPLAVLAGWGGVLTGNTIEAERWAAYLDGASHSSPPAGGSASFESMRAQLRVAMCPLGPDTMLKDAEFAVAQESMSSPWRHNALWSLGEAHLLVNDGDAARRRFTEASKTALESGMVDSLVIGEAELAIMAMDQGKWAEAGEHLDLALAIVDEKRMQDYVMSLLAFAGSARLALHHGDRERAQTSLTRAMRGRHLATYVLPFLAVRLRLQLARGYLALNDLGAARQLARECDEVVDRRPDLGTLNDQLKGLRDVLRSSGQTTTRMSILTPAEFRLLPYLQTYLTLAEIAERLCVSRNTVNSQIYAIYRKLGASSRREAVEQAIEKGLLGD
jgi:LuxR family transcriptional regulator, maltose regulon positive regulatory protein